MAGLENRYDVAVIGGGLTGLTAAVYLARSGKSVVLLEKDSRLGGLAQTEQMNGALFNLGPHAMYEGGAALRILRELDCLPDGGYASKSGMIGIWQGKIVRVPVDLTPEENEEWSKLMGGLGQIDTHSIRAISIRDWVDRYVRHERVRLFFYAMCRQWSYCDNMSELSAGYVIEQGQLAGQGVRYVDGGWQTVVEALRQAAIEAGTTIATGRSVEQIVLEDDRVRTLLLSDGTEFKVSAVIAANGPNEVCRLIQGAERMSIGRWKNESRPLYAACLDIALQELPYPERVFALGLDQPLYFSKHSGAVRLSDNGAHVLHVMRYNDNEASRDSKADEAELIRLLDLLEPGWEREVVASRFTPNVLVAHDSRTIRHQGAGPAPGPIVPEVRGLYVAGDWVGADGRLADAGMASAKQAALEVMRYV
ncbi:phytoene desaturase family protein [Paenibacillus nasutitermitis]|uniref:4,4'-diaponeurosporene oxygenase n=1 Tax=Paenibacillus nasutitermitis TaxID=1652958 RepID=A0A917E0L3_9BACL|nr:NAD(P)/FAD-dependent oxidoreductase [Paenibacillus nasutitermitis]GGD88327.1 dehydrogenase [Paenibacillus nasutitermitis]